LRDALILCGGAAGRARSGTTLRLNVNAPAGDPAKVNLNLSHISRRMVQHVPDRLADLLEIACYVFCADQFVRRDTPKMLHMGADWRRRLRFKIPVCDLEFWSAREIVETLTETLSFLSEDEYIFEFVRASPRGLDPYLDLPADDVPSGFTPDSVILFSGGLDSLAGASEALLVEGQRAVLVSHRSSKMVQSKQTELVQELRQRSRPARLFHVSVGVNKGEEEAREFTQRSRSFLFAALAFVVARLFRKSEITFFENGIVSLNLPIAEHVLGSRATRTTHPRVVSDFSRFFSSVAEDEVRVLNPYCWQTKTDVVRRLADIDCADLIAKAFSCTRVREATRRSAHCGLCSQCIDRRFAILAAGLDRYEPDDLYAVDLFLGERRPGPDLTLAESYVLTGTRLATITQLAFLARYGQVFRAIPYLDERCDVSAARLHQLHVRHGQCVSDVVERQSREWASVGKLLDLPETCLLAMIKSQTVRQPTFVDVVELEGSASEQARKLKERHVPRPMRFSVDETHSRVLFSGGVNLKGASFRLIAALLPTFRADHEANIEAAGRSYVRWQLLAKRLGGVTEQTVRQNVRRTRKKVAQQYLQKHDVVIAEDDVVQTLHWKGYRLNPYLALTPAALMEEESGADVTAAA
jgi:7-cyano-7-deazaguanine synthase in queuosine biosynthesis